MIRIMLRISYIGTGYRGVTFIEPFYRFRDLRTVQGILENSLKSIYKKRCDVCCSSRTDARVHALTTSFHADVEADTNCSFETLKLELLAALNVNLKYNRAAIRINDVELVDEANFMAHRNVENRKYLYRIAVKRAPSKIGDFIVPIEEVSRCYFIQGRLCTAEDDFHRSKGIETVRNNTQFVDM